MGLFKTVGKIGKGALKILAPTIADALPGPLGDIAKAAVTEALGLTKESTDEQIQKALATTDPAVLERVRKADQDFKVQMEKMNIDMEQVFADDRASARARQIAVKDKMPPVLAIFTWSAVIAVMGALFFYVPPGENKDMLLVLFGILVGQAKDIGGYYFGSSAGSARKTELLSNKEG